MEGGPRTIAETLGLKQDATPEEITLAKERLRTRNAETLDRLKKVPEHELPSMVRRMIDARASAQRLSE